MRRNLPATHMLAFSPNANGVGADARRATRITHAVGVTTNSLLNNTWSKISSCSNPKGIGHVGNVPHARQLAAKWSTRRGVSLVELMVVISVITILFSMVGVVFHRLFQSEQVSMRAALTERTISRLSDHFRRDVHAAMTAMHAMRAEAGKESPLSLVLKTSPNAGVEGSDPMTVVYSIDDGEVIREAFVDGRTASREVYRLPECQMRFPASTNEVTVEMVSLVIERQGSTVTPQPQAVRPRRSLVIEAALGRDAQLAATVAMKSPESVKEESK